LYGKRNRFVDQAFSVWEHPGDRGGTSVEPITSSKPMDGRIVGSRRGCIVLREPGGLMRMIYQAKTPDSVHPRLFLKPDYTQLPD
jgi:hypothetical protein